VAFLLAMKTELYPFQGVLLDKLLEAGFYRMHQHVFTTDFTFLNDDFYSLFWLRTNLSNIRFTKSQLKLQQVNKNFKVEISVLKLRQEVYDLFNKYRASINFDHVTQLDDFITEEFGINRFHSKEVCIYDQDQLIAYGIFDEGSDSIAGIINFYDPSYKKYSLGKYLMFLKCQYALSHQFKYYYPGYIAVGYHKFDYKIYPSVESVEILDAVQAIWLPYSTSILHALNKRFELFLGIIGD
jgi:arginyl-tRNA--protein-N-Asp/Glu arginylyltransferase